MSAAIEMCLVFIVMYPSDKRRRLYDSGAAKKTREEASTADWAMRWPTSVKSEAFM